MCSIDRRTVSSGTRLSRTAAPLASELLPVEEEEPRDISIQQTTERFFAVLLVEHVAVLLHRDAHAGRGILGVEGPLDPDLSFPSFKCSSTENVVVPSRAASRLSITMGVTISPCRFRYSPKSAQVTALRNVLFPRPFSPWIT